MVVMPPRHGKQCADSTPILTPTRWTTHGELRTGDYVYGSDGNPTKITGISGKTIANIRVHFTDGSSVDCHEKHEWTVYDRSRSSFKTIETKQFPTLSRDRARFQLPISPAIQMDENILKMHPYVLGAWLGDGTSTAPAITGDKKDGEVTAEVANYYPVSSVNVHKITGCLTTRFGSGSTRASRFGNDLRYLGVFGNKHIPDSYKYSSVGQRMELLAGLIDTDGSVDDKSRVRIVTVSERLAYDIKEVVASLGMRPYIMRVPPSNGGRNIIGRKDVYCVGFQPTMDIPTRIPRKKIIRTIYQRRIGIKYIEYIHDGETGNCIDVESGDGLYMVGKNMLLTHNSEIASIQFPAWVIGRNKDTQVIAASYSKDLAVQFGRQVRNIVADTSFKRIFSDVLLSEDSKSKSQWNTNGRGSYNAVGVGGALTGKGADYLIIDDPLKNRQDADSPVIRDNLWGWYRSTARTRLSPEGRICVVTTRWHDDDLVGRILEEGEDEWMVLHFPAIAENDEEYRKKGEPLWIDQYGTQALESIRKDIGLYEWSALYQGNPVDEETQEFKREWFKYRTMDEVSKMRTRKFATIDTALTKRDTSDYTGITRNWVNEEGDWNIKTTRHRMNSKEIIDTVFQLHEEGFEMIGIEEGAFTMAIQPFLAHEMSTKSIYPNIVMLKHGGVMKETRIRSLIPRYQNGKIFHIDSQELEDELVRFPKSRNDDAMDSLAYQSHIAAAPSPELSYIDTVRQDMSINNRTGYMQ